MHRLLSQRPALSRLFAVAALLLAFGLDPGRAATATENVPAEQEKLMLERIAVLENQLEQLRQSPPPGLDPRDRDKALGIVDRMLQHAGDDLRGMLAPPRYGWAYDGIQPPEELIETAAARLDTIRAGRDPWAGRFTEPGGHVVDHALIHKDGRHHLFYIRGKAVSNWPQEPSDNFGHAVSDDLRRWDILEPVLQSPAVGWDEFQVWAPHIIEHQGRYWMFYTGVNRHACQAIGLAVSEDLLNWRRHPANPLIRPGDWGVWAPGQWSDCRDPMVLRDEDGRFYCYYTAARKNDEGQVQSCAGVASSTDLLDWRDEGWIDLPKSRQTPPESIFVVQRGEQYYMLYTNYRYGISYATAPHPLRGWTEPEGESGTILVGASASEVYRVGEDWYLSYITHEPNGLHFFEVQRLVWLDDGGIALRPLDSDGKDRENGR